MKKQPVKQVWIQQTHQWRKDILVCTGFSAKEILQKIKSYKSAKWFVDWAALKQLDWQKAVDMDCAFVSQEPTHDAFVIRLRAFEDTWKFWETLIHELSHLVDRMAEAQVFERETEARAYLLEYLFKEIRQKLQGTVPKNSNGA